MDKLRRLSWAKLVTVYRDRDLFKRRFYMNVAIICRARSVYPKDTLGIFEEGGITSRGGFDEKKRLSEGASARGSGNGYSVAIAIIRRLRACGGNAYKLPAWWKGGEEG